MRVGQCEYAVEFWKHVISSGTEVAVEFDHLGDQKRLYGGHPLIFGGDGRRRKRRSVGWRCDREHP